MDLAIRFPDRDEFISRVAFFSPSLTIQIAGDFLERVFQAPEITQITIKSPAKGPMKFLERNWVTAPGLTLSKKSWIELPALLNPRKARTRQR